jgi:hypothetical protein
MATSVVPALIDALLAQARVNLPAILVFDGAYAATDEPGDYLMVGVDDPESTGPTAADTAQEVANMGTPRDRDESGSVQCAALSWNGEWDQKAARDAVYATFAQVEDLLRADPSLGLQAGGYLVAGIGRTTKLSQGPFSENGLGALLTFSIDFRARI